MKISILNSSGWMRKLPDARFARQAMKNTFWVTCLVMLASGAAFGLAKGDAQSVVPHIPRDVTGQAIYAGRGVYPSVWGIGSCDTAFPPAGTWELKRNGVTVASSRLPNSWKVSQTGLVSVPPRAPLGRYSVQYAMADCESARGKADLPPLKSYARKAKLYSFDVVKVTWSPHTTIGVQTDENGVAVAEDGRMLAPRNETRPPSESEDLIAAVGEEIECRAETATDMDKWTSDTQSGYAPDRVTYTWGISTSDGKVVVSLPASSSPSATLKMPEEFGEYVIWLKLDDSVPDGDSAPMKSSNSDNGARHN